MTDIEIASGFDAIVRLQPLWAEAAARSGGVGAFERFELVSAAAELAARRGTEPLVAVFRRDGRVRSLFPLRRERLVGVRACVPLVYPLAQYTDVVGAALEPNDLVRLSERLREKADVLLLRKVREDSGLHAALSQVAQSQYSRETAHYIDLAAFGMFAAYDASYSNRTRRGRRQRQQRLEAEVGSVTFEVLRGAEAATAFETAIDWKRRWLAERGLWSPVFDAAHWEGVLRDTVLAGTAIVTALKAGGTLAAVEIGFADRGAYVSYLGAFDAKLRAFSPGQLQMQRTIAWCFEQGFSRYDLLAPADDYKHQWSRTGTGVAIDDYAVALTHVGRGVAELRRRVRPLARDLYRRLSPEMRAAGGRYAMPAAAIVVAAAASAVMVAIE